MKLPPTPPVDAVKFCDFVTASPTPFHAVANLTTRLLSAGFKSISERRPDVSSLNAGGKFFYTRNQSSIVAFTLPSKHAPEIAISFAVGHLDSPCLKVRPVSKRVKEGYLQVGVELYGGGIWASWFDRDLSLAGRVIVSSAGANGPGYTSKLVKIDRPLLRIPTLAPHLDSSINEAFKFNKETEFKPILGLVSDTLNDTGVKSNTSVPLPGSNTPGGTKSDGDKSEDVAGMKERHHPMMLAVLADELDCSVEDIQDFELFSSIDGLCQAVEDGEGSSSSDIRCVMLFDNEEVGSISNHGAESDLLPSFVERIISLPDFSQIGYHQILANSFLISADMGHAINPNYAEKYESNHAPRMNAGVVIKTNAKQRYTSNAQTTFLLRCIAKKAGVPIQEFEIRNDSTCGSTVGPHLSTHVRTVDIGIVQLSMHSIRETCGSADVQSYIRLFKAYFEGFSEINKNLQVD